MVKINKIVEKSYVDGPGQRTVVFFQGCPIHCKGCQNQALWSFEGGISYDEEQLAKKLAHVATTGKITISGGEPFAQPASLAKLVYYLKKEGVQDIIVYSGYTWETIINPVSPAFLWVISILENVDVLVDGQFDAKQDDPFITYRGSRNQRPIDVHATLETGSVVILDWDEPEVVITQDGIAVLPAGLAPVFAEIGHVDKSRMCGQTSPL